MEKNLNFNRTLVAMAALVIVFAGIKLAAEIVVPFLLALFIAIICSPVIKAMTQRKVPDRKSTRLNSSHSDRSRMPSSA